MKIRILIDSKLDSELEVHEYATNSHNEVLIAIYCDHAHFKALKVRFHSKVNQTSE